MRSPMSSRSAIGWPGLVVLLIVRLALGAYTSLTVPPWESYDETGHFQYARYIAVTGHLLDPNDPETARIRSSFQPPLYYLLIAPVLEPFNLGAVAFEPEVNPYLSYGIAGLNYAVETADPTADQVGQIAALRAMRLAGVVISSLSTIFLFLAARRLWPGRDSIALAVAGIFAFWPQFVFIGSMATNDLLVTSLAAVLVYFIVRTRQDGLSVLNAGLLAAVTGAAILTKLNGFAFVVPSALTVILGAIDLKEKRSGLLAVAGLALLVALALTLLLGMDFVTGQVLQLETLQRFVTNLSENGLTLAQLLDLWSYTQRTFVASYGWGNVETWSFVYPLFDAWLAIGLIGAVIALIRRPPDMSPGTRSSLLLSSTVLLSLAALALALAIAQSDPHLVVGRYILPALPGLVLLVCAGWMAFMPAQKRSGAVTSAAFVVAAISWATPAGILAPVYAQPTVATPAELASVDTRLGALFAPGMRLIGARLAEADGPEKPLTAFLCWQADRVITANYPLKLTLVGPDGQGYGLATTYPGHGNFPSSLWTPGLPFCETYQLEVRGDYPAPAQGSVLVSFLTSPKTQDEVPAVDLAGQALSAGPHIAAVVHGQAMGPVPTPAQLLNIRFGDSIVLEGITFLPRAEGQGLNVLLFWRSTAPITADISVFAHLRTSPTDLFLQDDSRPRDDQYPTNQWRPGESVLDLREFPFSDEPAGPLSFYVGMYTDARRLPAVTSSGERLVDDEFSLLAWPLR